MRVALEATAFALPLDDIDAHIVATAMDAGTDLYEEGGFIWSAQGLSALLALRERAEVIVALDGVDLGLSETLLGWGLGFTVEPLDTMHGTAVIIACTPFALTEAMAHIALEAS